MKRWRALVALLLMTLGMAVASWLAVLMEGRCDIPSSAVQRTIEDLHLGSATVVAVASLAFALVGSLALACGSRLHIFVGTLVTLESAYVLWVIVVYTGGHLAEKSLRLMVGPTLLSWSVSIAPFFLLVVWYFVGRFRSVSPRSQAFLWCLVFYWAHLGGVPLFSYHWGG